MLNSPDLPQSTSVASTGLEQSTSATKTALDVIEQCCKRHHRATEAVAELQAVCHKLLASTAASEADAVSIKQALEPYTSIDACSEMTNILDRGACEAHIRLLRGLQQLATAPEHMDAAKFRMRAMRLAKHHRSQLREFIMTKLNEWPLSAAAGSAPSLQAQSAALLAQVLGSKLGHAVGFLRLSSTTAPDLEAEDRALVSCSEHFFSVRQDMLQQWAPAALGSPSAPEVCAAVRQAREALRQEATLHGSLLRSRQQMEAMGVSALCATEQALLLVPGEEGALASGLAALAVVLLGPLGSSSSTPATVAELSELMASVRDELAVMASGSSSMDEQSAAAAVTQACESCVLDGVQDRLMFAAERDIVDVLAAWQPSAAGDVDFPGRFAAHRRSIAQGPVSPQLQAARDVTHTWFPPMYRCLRALSSVYRALTRGAFATCAQQAVAQLLAAMGRAATTITANNGPLHGQLFLISQLLILREQLAPFDVSLAHTQHHLQLPSASDALSTLVQGLPGLLKWGEGNLLYDLITGRIMPALVQVDTDGRRDLESSLKSTCERFIGLQSSALAAPLSALLPSATPPQWGNAKAIIGSWTEVFQEDFPHLRRQLALYLGSAVTHRILLTPIADSVKQVLNKCRAAATSAQDPAAAAAADTIRGAVATVTAAMDEDDAAFDPHLPQYWAEQQGGAAAAAE